MIICLLHFVHFVVPMGIFPTGNLGHFSQGKPAATELESHYPTLINNKVHAGSFHGSVIHRTLTWTTGSLSCIRDRFYVCVYTLGLGTPTASQHENLRLGKTLTNFVLVLPTGVRTLSLWILSPMFCQLSHPITPNMQLNMITRKEVQSISHLHGDLSEGGEVSVFDGLDHLLCVFRHQLDSPLHQLARCPRRLHPLC